MSDSPGLMESLKQLVGTLLGIVQTRLELLSNEFEEERLRIRLMLLFGSIALFFFGLSIMLVTVLIVVIFWDSHRDLVLGGLAALFFITGIFLSNRLCGLAREKPRLFSASLAELADDRDQLDTRP